jgi:hypothetical protein
MNHFNNKLKKLDFTTLSCSAILKLLKFILKLNLIFKIKMKAFCIGEAFINGLATEI